jgi:carbonic anhydrase
MRLFETIVDANHRALAGDPKAGLHPAEFADALPVVALSCIDVRLNPLLPEVLGIPEEEFIWLRNAGNVITGPLSSTMRSLALACAIKGGKEIAVIGHTDCQVGKTTATELIERFRALGIERNLLPQDLIEYFGTFASERTNVIKATDIIRHSPLIGPRTPVHGLLVDVQTGKLEWLVNGYQTLETMRSRSNELVQSANAFESLADFNLCETELSQMKIGEWQPAPGSLSQQTHQVDAKSPPVALQVRPGLPPKIPLPLKSKSHFPRT